MTSRVFMPAWSSKFDSAPAKKFGEIIYLMRGEKIVNPFNTERLVSLFYEELDSQSFDQEADYIALTGGHIFVAFLLATAAVSYDKVKILLFDASTNKYVERVFEVPEESEAKEPAA